VGGLAFSPDGRRLAAGYFDRLIDVWDTTTGKPLGRLEGHTGVLQGLAFSPDGGRLASNSQDRSVRIWDVSTGQEVLHLRGHTDWCQGLAFSADGRLLASASKDGTIRLWDATPLTGKEGQEVLTFREHTHEVISVAISPDGKRIASAGIDPTVRVWDATTAQVTQNITEITRAVFSVAFSTDGKLAAAGFGDAGHVVQVWDAETGQNAVTFREPCPIISIGFSPDGSWLALGRSDGTVKLVNARTGRDGGVLGKHDRQVHNVRFRPDGRRVVSVGEEGIVKVWDVTPGHQLLRAWVPVLGLWPQTGGSTHLPLAAGVQLQLALWSETSGPQAVLILRSSGLPLYSVAYSPDGHRLVTGRTDGQLTLWQAETGKEISTVRGPFGGEVRAVAFSRDRRWVASAAEDCTVKVGDAATLAWRHTFRGHMLPCKALAFTPDGRRLVSASQDKTVKVWDLTRLDRKLK
jgi:WD40 repeat protein